MNSNDESANPTRHTVRCSDKELGFLISGLSHLKRHCEDQLTAMHVSRLMDDLREMKESADPEIEKLNQ